MGEGKDVREAPFHISRRRRILVKIEAEGGETFYVLATKTPATKSGPP